MDTESADSEPLLQPQSQENAEDPANNKSTPTTMVSSNTPAQQQEDVDLIQSGQEENINESTISQPTIILSTPPSRTYKCLLGSYIIYTTAVGYTVSTQPTGAGWRFFSWHPFLMTTGFIGLLGVSAITKKLGGYKNTKIHAILSSLGVVCACIGFGIIYKNKQLIGKDHFTSTHSIFGIVTISCAFLPWLAGGIFLHPDFGIDRTSNRYRCVLT
jgi:hypothetical protein